MVALKPRMYSFLIDDNHAEKIRKDTKKCVIKLEIRLENYKIYLKNNKTILKTQQRFKSAAQNVFTKKLNKVALNENDHRKIQTPDGVTTYQYDYGCYIAFLECTKTKIN